MFSRTVDVLLRTEESAEFGPSSAASDYSGSDTDTDTSESECGIGEIDITLERLQSLCDYPQKPVSSEYAKHGLSKRRMKVAVSSPICPCKCTMPLRLLAQLCLAFWVLSKSKQDAVLWSIQHESGDQRKKRWYLAGLRRV